MADLIGHAVDRHLNDGRISAIELFEILSDSVNKAEFKNHYGPDNESHDGLTEYRCLTGLSLMNPSTKEISISIGAYVVPEQNDE